MKKKKIPSYKRLNCFHRRCIEEGLNQRKSLRSIAQDLGLSASTVAREVRTNMVYARSLKDALQDNYIQREEMQHFTSFCSQLKTGHKLCNGCHLMGNFRCFKKQPHLPLYVASIADMLSRQRKSASRCGIDMQKEDAQKMMDVVKECVEKNQSLRFIASTNDQVCVSASTLYSWIDKGVFDICNLDLLMKVRYKPHKKSTESRKYMCPQ